MVRKRLKNLSTKKTLAYRWVLRENWGSCVTGQERGSRQSVLGTVAVVVIVLYVSSTAQDHLRTNHIFIGSPQDKSHIYRIISGQITR